MAAAKSDNFYMFLKDRTAKIDDRLKVLRYAWTSSDVYIPNKEQVLVDILTGLLLNKKKEQLGEDDTEHIWRCLQDVLQTRKASEPGLILLRQSSTQMLIDCLLAVDEHYRFTSPLIGCFNAMMKSDSLSTVFTIKLDTMISVLQGLCGVLALDSYKDDDLMISLVQHTVDRFIHVLKTAPGQQKILQKSCNIFLPKLITLWSSQPTETVQHLSSAFHAVLGNMDHHHNYDVYLKARHSKSEACVHKKAKYLEHLFTALAKLLQANQEQCCLFLPVIYENFIENKCHRGIYLTAHFMMQELCSLIGLNIDNNNLSGPIKTAVVIRTVNQLLKSIEGRELYDQHLDEKNGSFQFKFYKHIAQVLIGCKELLKESGVQRYYSDWYSCFTILLQVNHHAVEPRLLEIFTLGWIDTEVKPEDVAALDEFLYELMNIYFKLRQVPKLITTLIRAFCACDSNRPVQLTSRFLKCYIEVIQSLPQGVMLDVWKKFAASLKVHFVDPTTKQDTGHFQGICALFHEFLMNIKVADYTVTDLTRKSVQELMAFMETDILGPLLKELTEEKDNSKLKYTLLLGQAWGDIAAMLALYTNHKTSEFQSKSVVWHSGDLSYVHGYLENDQWRRIHTHVTKCGDPGLQYVWEMLVVQKVRTVLLFREKCDWTALADAISTVVTNLENADVGKMAADWSGMLEDVTETNLQTARWHLLTSNMAAICCVLSDHQLKTVADFAFRCMVCCHSSSSSKKFSSWTTSSEFLKSPIVQESGTLLSCLVTSVWTRCAKLFTRGDQKSPKKKKKDAVTTSFQQITSVIGSSDLCWSQDMTSANVDKLKEASKALLAMWNSTDTLHFEDRKVLHNCVKILQYLPLEHLWSCDQSRCLIGSLAVKCLTNRTDDQSENENTKQLATDCVELCTCIVETMDTKPLFEILAAPVCLDLMQKLLSSFTIRTPEYYRCLVFVEMTCRAVVRDEDSMEKMLPYTDKLCLKIGKRDGSEAITLAMCTLQEVSKLLNNNPSVSDNILATCRKIFKSLSHSVLKLSPLLDSSNRDHLEAVLVRIYAAMLPVVHKNEEIKKEVQEIFSKIVHWCENVLNNVETTGVYTVLSALKFLHTFSKHHVTLKVPLNIEDKLRIWRLLVTVLRKLLYSQCGESGNQTHSVFDNQSVERGTQSKKAERCQSKRKAPNSQSDDGNLKSPKKQRKSTNERIPLDNSPESSPYDDEIQDDLSRQASRIATILNRRTDESNVTQNKIDSSRCQIADSGIHASEIDEVALNPSVMYSMHTSLMFEGRLESQRIKVIKMQVQSMMAELLLTFDLERFKEILQELVDGVHANELYRDRSKLRSSLYIWRYLLKHKFSDEQTVIIRYSARDMMLNVQCISQQLQYTVSEDLLTEVAVPVLHTQQQMLASGPKFLGSRSSVLCLYSCLYTPLGGSVYFPAFNAVYNVLDTFLIHHQEVVFQNIPTFLTCSKRLLLSVVEQSDQDKIAQQPEIIKGLLGCAFEMEKLFSLMATHKVEFGKVAVYVVSDYVTAVQKVTLLPAVKRALVPAVHKMLDLCDRHAVAQLHVILGDGVKEVFKLLFHEYKKFHKYQGKI